MYVCVQVCVCVSECVCYIPLPLLQCTKSHSESFPLDPGLSYPSALDPLPHPHGARVETGCQHGTDHGVVARETVVGVEIVEPLGI